MAVKILVSSA